MRTCLFLFSLTALIALSGCTSDKVYKVNYDKAVTIMKERFDRNQWTSISTEYGYFCESTKGTNGVFHYRHWQFPENMYRYQINLDRVDSDNTKITVKIMDHDSFWYPIFAEGTREDEFHIALATRFRDGKWPRLSTEPVTYVGEGDKRPEGTQVPPVTPIENN